MKCLSKFKNVYNKDVALYRFQDLNVVTLRNNKENILGLFSLFSQTDLYRTSKKDATSTMIFKYTSVYSSFFCAVEYWYYFYFFRHIGRLNVKNLQPVPWSIIEESNSQYGIHQVITYQWWYYEFIIYYKDYYII